MYSYTIFSTHEKAIVTIMLDEILNKQKNASEGVAVIEYKISTASDAFTLPLER